MTQDIETDGRRRMPNRRASTTVEFEYVHSNGNRSRHLLTYSVYEDGTVGEIFVDAHKQATGLAEQARDAAIALTIALQYGTPMEAIRSAIGRDEDGRPHTIIGSALDTLKKETGK